MGFGSHLVRAGNEINVVWVPAHSGVEGNEHVGGLTKEAAEGGFPHSVPVAGQPLPSAQEGL